MKRIRIEYFNSIDNYGTGMMGLVTIDALARRFGAEHVEFLCDFHSDEALEEARRELPGGIRLSRLPSPEQRTATLPPLRRKLTRLNDLLFSSEGKGLDMIVVLGGDDLSEYYSPWAPALALLRKWRASFRTRIVLLGQTIGPFDRPLNRWMARRLIPRMETYARDEKSAEYLRREFGLAPRQMADLALCDLPLQQMSGLREDTLSRFGLEADDYICVVVSGCQQGGKYYCSDRALYTGRYREIVRGLLGREELAGKKIVLLAHTFGTHGQEADYIREVTAGLTPEEKSRIVEVTQKIGPTRARIILQNGLFTITGRMHAAVSTFQGGKPALSLAYGSKYAGVIGQGLGRDDLIVDADLPELWESGEIVTRTAEKIGYLLGSYDRLRAEIAPAVAAQRQKVEQTLENL